MQVYAIIIFGNQRSADLGASQPRYFTDFGDKSVPQLYGSRGQTKFPATFHSGNAALQVRRNRYKGQTNLIVCTTHYIVIYGEALYVLLYSYIVGSLLYVFYIGSIKVILYYLFYFGFYI